MKKLLAAVLTVVMLFSVVGCASVVKSNTIVGNWKASIDFGAILEEEMGDMDELGMDLDLDDMKIYYLFNLKEDGTYTLSLDGDSYKAAFSKLKPALEAALKEFLGDDLGGYSIDDLFGDMFSDEAIEEVVEEAKVEGQYKAENGKMYLSSDPDEAPDESDYLEYTLDSTLKITGSSSDAFDSFPEELLPLEFKK